MTTNHDITAINAVINAGITNVTSKNTEMMTKLASDQAELLSDIGKMQSWNIVAGLMPDDGDDIKKAIAEMKEEFIINLGELQNSVEAWETSVVAMVDAPGFMRVDKSADDEEEIK